MISSRRLEKELFEEAVGITDPAERAAFLDGVGRTQPALHRRLERLLAALEPAETFLTLSRGAPAPPPSTPTERPPSSAPGAAAPAATDQREADSLPGLQGGADMLAESRVRIGRYRLLQRLGEGGCGVVYLAEQEEPVRRQVALKIIRLGMDTETVIARFGLERQTLALMDHPNIARVLDAGATESGRPYFVMERVHGIRITDFCDQHRLTVEQRLALFVRVCLAIQHAHQKGILHRDIKPSNILVAQHDGVPVPKVIDFGVAKAIESRLGDDSLPTSNLQLVGTPAYMSPEQADLNRRGIDTRSDIYSLGVVLHELLTGRTPFDSKRLVEAGVEEMRRILREQEPLRPSALLASLAPEELRRVAELRGTDPRKLVASVRGDLDWIVTTTLEKERSRRYETANGLVMDIRRHLDTEPVSARPASRRYRLQKLVRRNRVVFGAGLIVFLALVVGLGSSTWLFVREREARREQARLRDEAELARANEARLRQQAEARERVTQAAVHLSHGERAEADALVNLVPLDQLPPSLECIEVLRTLGNWHALDGRWSKAARRSLALALVITETDDSDSDDVSRGLLPAAAAIREGGNEEDYETFRQRAARRFSDTLHPVVAEQVLKATLLAPADSFTLRALVPLAEIVTATVQGQDPMRSEDPYMDAWRCFALALFAHRRELPDQTLRWADQCLLYANTNAPRTAAARLLRAMALHRQGEAAEARFEMDRPRILIEEQFRDRLRQGNATTGFWFDWINARQLLREAAAELEN